MPKTARILSFRAWAIVSTIWNLYAENTKARLFGQNGKYREKGDEKDEEHLEEADGFSAGAGADSTAAARIRA